MENSLDLCSESCSCGRCLGEEDRISFLPQDILWLILSFLTPKDVLKTSLLSRRWLDLWVHSPILNLHRPKSYLRAEVRPKYVEWVNCVLRRHKGHYLEEFKIGCALDNSHRKDIDKWLIFALKRKVRRLEMNLRRFLHYGRDTYVFPRFLNLNCGIGLPQFDLKCLKSLSLESVDVTGEAINFILQDCPFLERLKVANTRKLVDLVISNPTLVLKYLQIKYCSDLKVVSISNINLVSLDIPSVRDVTLTDIPMLVELSLWCSSLLLSACVSRGSSCLFQLQALTLGACYLKDVIQLSNLAQLKNLKRLVIGIVIRDDGSPTKLISMLNSCPRLEEFVLKLCWVRPECSNKTFRDVKRLSGSSSLESKHCLKVFELLGYDGCDSDVELVMRILEEYGSSLEKLIIDPIDVHLVTHPHLELRWNRRPEERRSCSSLKIFENLSRNMLICLSVSSSSLFG